MLDAFANPSPDLSVYSNYRMSELLFLFEPDLKQGEQHDAQEFLFRALVPLVETGRVTSSSILFHITLFSVSLRCFDEHKDGLPQLPALSDTISALNVLFFPSSSILFVTHLVSLNRRLRERLGNSSISFARFLP